MTSIRARQWSVLALVALWGLALAADPQRDWADASQKQTGKKGAGGVAIAHLPGGKPVESTNAPEARLFRIGMDAVEPTLGVTYDGQIFYTAFQSNTRVDIVRSSDGGRSWKVVSPQIGGRNTQLLSFDPYVFVDNLPDKDNSRVFTIDLTVACSYLSFSDDRGKTWTTNPLACGRPVNDHQTLFAGPPAVSSPIGYPHVVYYCWNDVATSSCSKSLDGGLTFAPTGTPPYPGAEPSEGRARFCGGLHGHGYVGADGTVYVPKGHCGQPWLSISRDEGRTWERVQVADIGTADHEASVATDKANNIYYTWIGADRLPYLVISKNGGESWTKPMMIGAPGLTEANLPSLDVGGVGKVAIAYMGTTNAHGNLEQREYTDVTWNGYMTISANALDATPVFYSAPVNDPRDPLVRGRCGPGRRPAVYDFIDIVIAPNGRAYSAYVDGCTALCAQKGPANAGREGIVGQLIGGPKLR